jgi:hypothetical protein
MKTCLICKQQKPLNDFSYCRQCDAKRAHEWAKAHPDMVAAQQRRWRATHQPENTTRKRQWELEHRTERLESRRRRRQSDGSKEVARQWRCANRQKWQAHNILNSAIQRGEVKRPTECLVCGNESVHAHHPDYSKPLDVVWLCRVCHAAIHRKYQPLELKAG